MGSRPSPHSMLRAIRRYSSAAPKVLALSRREWRQLAAAQFQLLHAQLRLWTTKQGKLLSTAAGSSSAAAPSTRRVNDARELALAIGRAAEYGVFRPACLARSMALCRLLESSGIDGGRVQIGVILREGRFVAHAWVEYAGEILGDDEGIVSKYEPLVGMNRPGGKVGG